MRIGLSAILVLPLSLLGLAACQPDPFPQGGCTLVSVGDLPVLTSQGSPIIPVTVNGTKVSMVVDTGGGSSMLSGSIVDSLNLEQKLTNEAIEGADGSAFVSQAIVNSLGVGIGTIHNLPMTITPAAMNRKVGGLPLAGLFGGDFLYNYDVHFDLPDRQFSFFQEFHCPVSQDIDAATFGWKNQYYELPFQSGGTEYYADKTKIQILVELNGHKTEAIFDSGAGRTTISLRDAHAAGVTDAMLAQDTKDSISGVVGNHRAAWIHRFDTFAVGPEHFTNIPLLVTDSSVPTLLGADFLQRHRMLVSYRRNKMLIELPFRISSTGAEAAPPAPTGPAAPLAPGQAPVPTRGSAASGTPGAQH